MAGATASVTDGWSRNRLLAILASAGVVALVLLLGLGYAIYLAIHSSISKSTGQHALSGKQMHSSIARGRAYRDRIAATPMLAVDADAMKPSTPTTQLAAPITIPEPTSTGADQVPTGFAHTPQGAIGQLAAIAETVLSTMSVPAAHQIYTDWSLPGGPGAAAWPMTSNVTSFLGAAQMGATKSPAATITATPAAAQIKGTDGPDWTLACVLFEIDATITSQSSIGYGYCERMQWTTDAGTPAGGRWLIGPGSPPALAPSTWPGSATALKAGWLTWTTTNKPAAGNPATGAADNPSSPAGANGANDPSVPAPEPTEEPES